MVPPFFADIGRHGPLPLRCKRMGGPRFHFEKTRRGGGLPLPSYNKGAGPFPLQIKEQRHALLFKRKEGMPLSLERSKGQPFPVPQEQRTARLLSKHTGRFGPPAPFPEQRAPPFFPFLLKEQRGTPPLKRQTRAGSGLFISLERTMARPLPLHLKHQKQGNLLLADIGKAWALASLLQENGRPSLYF